MLTLIEFWELKSQFFQLHAIADAALLFNIAAINLLSVTSKPADHKSIFHNQLWWWWEKAKETNNEVLLSI